MREIIERYQRQLLVVGAIVSAGIFLFFLLRQEKPETGKVLEETMELAEPTKTTSTQTKESFYFADIKGGIERPGMYQISENTRLADLVALAGGFSTEADTLALNLALKIEDQMLIYVPLKGKESPVLKEEVIVAGEQTEEKKAEGKININVATISELQELDGIGPKKAESIINYREENGSFKKPEDIMEISGIGEKTYANFSEKISVD